MTFIQQDLWYGKLVPSSHQTSKPSHTILWTFSRCNNLTSKVPDQHVHEHSHQRGGVCVLGWGGGRVGEGVSEFCLSHMLGLFWRGGGVEFWILLLFWWLHMHWYSLVFSANKCKWNNGRHPREHLNKKVLDQYVYTHPRSQIRVFAVDERNQNFRTFTGDTSNHILQEDTGTMEDIWPIKLQISVCICIHADWSGSL